MIQIVPVGDGFLVLGGNHQHSDSDLNHLRVVWEGQFPDVKALFLNDAEYIQLGKNRAVFEFKGERLTQEVVDEFRRWWGEREAAPKVSDDGSDGGTPRP